MKGMFITFEGTEGSGKSTQIERLARRLEAEGLPVRQLREPGGTAIGEEIRHTVKHSQSNDAMMPETELLLINASRAQLVREVIQPALKAGEWVLCDRFYDSSTVYQGYGRQLNLASVQQIIRFAVGSLKPDRTVLLRIPLAVSESRRAGRQDLTSRSDAVIRDRLEEAGRPFFQRVELGYDQIAQDEPDRIAVIDATPSVDEVEAAVWQRVRPLVMAAQATPGSSHR
jgi:dTMP kinase